MLVIFFAGGLLWVGSSLLLRFFPSVERTDRFILAFPTGACFFTLSLFCLNQTLGFPIGRRSLLALLLGATAWAAGVTLRRLRSAPPPSPPGHCTPMRPLSPLAKVELVLLVGLLSTLICAGSLAPLPHWDINSEYYPLQKELFLTRAFPVEASPSVTELIHAFPPGYTMLATCGHILHGGMLHLWSRALSPLYAILILCLLFRIGKRHLALSPEALLAALILCASLPLFAEYMTVPASTLIFCFYSLAGLYCILEYAASGQRRTLALAGVLLGMSYWISYTAIVLIPCICVTLIAASVISRFSRGRMDAPLRIPPIHWILFITGIAVIAAPHLIRNTVFFKNPVYPALYQFFGGMFIDEWSIRQFLVRLVPAHGIYLRPRWEIFHEGFFIQLLFVLSLLSCPWYRRRGGLVLALFCVLYNGFFLAFFTWPRAEGISTKLLLPSLIPACLFAGERLTRILRREIPWVQAAIILALVPLWSAVMLHDEILFLAVRKSASWHRFPDWTQLVSALCVDLDEILIWIGVALCCVTAFPRRPWAPGALASGILLFGVLCRPFSEGSSAIVDHAYTAAHDRSYSFWNAAVFPSYFPEAGWLDKELPRDAVIGTFDNRTYMFPRRVFPMDIPPLWPLYQGLDIDGCVALLRRNGITHLCIADFITRRNPLYGKSALFGHLGDPAYFPLIYPGSPGQEPGHELRVYAVGRRR